MKFYTKVVLGFISLVWLTACSGLGFSFEEKRTAIITRPPIQIAITGDVGEDVTGNILAIVRELNKEEYVDYKFNENLNVSLDSSDISTESTSSISNMSSNRNRTVDVYDVPPPTQ